MHKYYLIYLLQILMELSNLNHKWDVLSQQHEGAITRQCMHLTEERDFLSQ